MEQNDVAPELLDRLQKDFDKRMAENQKLAGLYEKVNAGNATYLEVNDFALEAGNILADVFQDNISESDLPDGRMHYNIADRVIRPMMVNNYNIISSVCMNVQGRLNQKAKLGLKAIKPDLNEDKVHGIVNKVSSAERYGDVAWVLGEPMRTFSQSIVDDSIKANVSFQGKAGLYPRIERIAAAGCCEWCDAVAGTYRYPNVPKDVYRRHGHCRCTVEYDPADGRGQRQNVHDKSWRNFTDSAIMEQRRTIGLEDPDQQAKVEYRKSVGLSGERISGKEREVRASWKLAASKNKENNSASKREYLGYVDPENAERAIQYFADQIRNEAVEHVIVIEKSGKVIHFIGDESGIRKIDADFNGAHVLHNHPAINGILSFGKDDFVTIRGNQSAKYYLCNEEYDYRLEVIKDMSDL